MVDINTLNVITERWEKEIDKWNSNVDGIDLENRNTNVWTKRKS